MAAAKTNSNTPANPIEEATRKVTEFNEEASQKVAALAEQTTTQLTALNEEAAQKFAAFAEQTTQKLTELTEQANVTQKHQTLAAIDSYEQAVLALVDTYEKAAVEPKVELPNIAGVTREITTAYTAAARQYVS